MFLRLYLLVMTIVGAYCGYHAQDFKDDKIPMRIFLAGGGFAWGCGVFNMFVLLFLFSIALAFYITTGSVPQFLLNLWHLKGL